MGKRKRRRSSKEIKKNTNINAKGKCKSNGKFSLLHSTQRNLLLQQHE